MMTKHERGSVAGAFVCPCVVPSMMHDASCGSGKGQAQLNIKRSSKKKVRARRQAFTQETSIKRT